MKWFANVGTVQELRKRYRELLKQFHPDNGGSEEIMKEINTQYDAVFGDLSKETKADGEAPTYEEEAENEAFKAILNEITGFDMEIELIGNWIWCFNSYNYRNRLKELGFKFAPKKRAWCWHYGEYQRHHKGEISMDDIRSKYGSQKIARQLKKRYSLN